MVSYKRSFRVFWKILHLAWPGIPEIPLRIAGDPREGRLGFPPGPVAPARQAEDRLGDFVFLRVAQTLMKQTG